MCPDASKAKESRAPKAPSEAFVKWLLLAGVLTLVALPVLTIKLAEWKIRQDQMREAALDRSPEALNFGGPFTLVTHDGKKVTEATFKGKYLLVFFGYTYCPDLCPTALQTITETLEELGPEAAKARTLFITIDPARDTPGKLKNYISAFHSDIIGLTGTTAQIEAVTSAYHVRFAKIAGDGNGDYELDQSTYMYVLDPEGNPLARMDMEYADPVAAAAVLKRLWDGKIKPLR